MTLTKTQLHDTLEMENGSDDTLLHFHPAPDYNTHLCGSPCGIHIEDPTKRPADGRVCKECTALAMDIERWKLIGD